MLTFSLGSLRPSEVAEWSEKGSAAAREGPPTPPLNTDNGDDRGAVAWSGPGDRHLVHREAPCVLAFELSWRLREGEGHRHPSPRATKKTGRGGVWGEPPAGLLCLVRWKI